MTREEIDKWLEVNWFPQGEGPLYRDATLECLVHFAKALRYKSGGRVMEKPTVTRAEVRELIYMVDGEYKAPESKLSLAVEWIKDVLGVEVVDDEKKSASSQDGGGK